MKYLLYFCPLLLFNEPNQEYDCISWDHRKLKIGDFTLHTKDSLMQYEAITNSEVSYFTNGKIFIICNRFRKKKSWARPTFNWYGLNHEQRHFDISEIYARKLRKALTGITFEKRQNEIIDSLFAEKNAYQMKYDLETDFSQDSVKQAEWDTLIDQELQALELYKQSYEACECVEE